jgi:hypothetical protein
MSPPGRFAPGAGLTAILALWLAGLSPAGAEEYSAWVAARFTAAECAAGLAAPRRDPDADGWPNLLEYVLGSGPRDAASRPRPEFAGGAPSEARLRVVAGGGSAGLRVLLSADLADWWPAPVVVPAGGGLVVPLGSARFLRVEVFGLPGRLLDSDGDGLHDLFEEQLLAEAGGEPAGGIGELDPLGDADGDGTPNIEEAGNRRPPGCGFPEPPLLDPAQVAAAADSAAAAPPVLVVHTPLR